MKIYDRQEFFGLFERYGLFDRSGKLISDMLFKHCSFVGCSISATTNVRKRSIVRNIELINCSSRGNTIYTAIIEDVLVSSLKTYTLLQTWAAVFKHVKLEGNIGRIMISPLVDAARPNSRVQAAFEKANADYYQDVDWALDISEGRFVDCDIRRVPAKLVRRDPETQVVITREKALMGEWKKLDLSKTYWATAIEFLLESGDQDMILVAPKRYSKYPDLLDGLKMLRDAGVAEPD